MKKTMGLFCLIVIALLCLCGISSLAATRDGNIVTNIDFAYLSDDGTFPAGNNLQTSGMTFHGNSGLNIFGWVASGNGWGDITSATLVMCKNGQYVAAWTITLRKTGSEHAAICEQAAVTCGLTATHTRRFEVKISNFDALYFQGKLQAGEEYSFYIYVGTQGGGVRISDGMFKAGSGNDYNSVFMTYQPQFANAIRLQLGGSNYDASTNATVDVADQTIRVDGWASTTEGQIYQTDLVFQKDGEEVKRINIPTDMNPPDAEKIKEYVSTGKNAVRIDYTYTEDSGYTWLTPGAYLVYVEFLYRPAEDTAEDKAFRSTWVDDQYCYYGETPSSDNQGWCITNTCLYEGICEGTYGEPLAWHISHSGTLFIQGSGDMPDFSETQLPPWASYADCVQKIKVGEGIENIGAYAFIGYNRVTEITIPCSVRTIGDYAFSDCKNLTDIYYGGSEELWNILEYDFDDAFENATLHCALLGCGYGDNTMWTLDFDGCLTISGIGEMGYEYPHWSDYRESITSVQIESGVTTIADEAFAGCVNLTSVSIPETVERIGEYAFLEAGISGTGISSIYIPASVMSSEDSIAPTAFSYANIQAIEVDENNPLFFSEDGVLFLRIEPGYDEGTLLYSYPMGKPEESYAVPDHVVIIPQRAFCGSSLKEVHIPTSVVGFGTEAFYDCEALTDVYYDGFELTWNYINGEHYNDWTSVTIHFQTEISGTCGTISWTLDETGLLTIVGNEVEEWEEGPYIPGYDEYRNEGGLNPLSLGLWRPQVQTVKIEDGIIAIGEESFYNCWNITSIHIPVSVSYIGWSAFDEYGALTDVYYDGFASMWNTIEIMDGNTALTDATLHFQTEVTGTWGTVSWTLDDTGLLTIVGNEVGEGEEGPYIPEWNYDNEEEFLTLSWYPWRIQIQTVKIEDGIIGMGEYAFDECRNITSIYIPTSVTYIAQNAFCYTALTDVYYAGSKEQWDAITIEANNKPLTDATLHYVRLEVIYDFETNGGTSATKITEEVKFGDLADLSVTATKTGWEFVGWNTNPDAETALAEYTVTDNVTLYAIYKKTLIASFYCGANELQEIKTMDIYNNQTSGMITMPGVNSYWDWSFIGWRMDTTADAPQYTEASSVSMLSDQAFYGVYQKIHTVSYDANGGNSTPQSHTSVQYYNASGSISTCAVILANAISRTDYTFQGWKKENESEPIYAAGESITIEGDTKMVAQWVRTSRASGTCGENLTWVLYPNGDLVIDGIGAMTEWSYYSDVPWYGYRSYVRTIEIGKDVTSIGNYAFYNCRYVEKIIWHAQNAEGLASSDKVFSYCGEDSEGIDVVFLDSVESIPDYLLYSCGSSVKSITLGNNVTTIGAYSFRGCTALQSIAIPESVTQIGPQAFSSCSALTAVHITDIRAWCGIQIGDELANPLFFAHNLYVNGELLETLVVPDGVINIRAGAFLYCTSLQSITIPGSVTQIGSGAFSRCTGLQSVTLCEGVEEIGSNAFVWCAGLQSITIPGSVTQIGSGAFNNCTELQNITLCEGLTEIGSNAFDGCAGLQSITIPESVTQIGSAAFLSCTGLQNVTLCEGVEEIGSYAFDGCAGLQSVTIPGSVTQIGEYAFRSCTELQNVTLCEGLEEIGSYTFEGCTGIQEIIVPNSVQKIGVSAFVGCSSLTEMSLPFVGEERDGTGALGFFGHLFKDSAGDTYQYYASSSYYNDYYMRCTIPTGLTRVTITDATTIGYGAFSHCERIEEITINKGVSSIGKAAFYGCSSIKEITIPVMNNSIFYLFINPNYNGDTNIPESLTKVTVTHATTIPQYAFDNCVNITDIKLNDGITRIGSNAFDNSGYYNNAENWDGDLLYIGQYLVAAKETVSIVSIKEGTTVLADRIFEGCTGLMKADIPEGVKTLPTEAFCGCTELLRLSLPDSITTIESKVFYNCGNLLKFTVPNQLTEIGEDAFYGCSNLAGVYLSDLAAWCRISIRAYDDNPLYYAQKMYLNGQLVENLQIPEGITIINNYTFYNCDSIKTVVIPAEVVWVMHYAFYGCNSLTDLIIGNGVKSIRSDAFANCSSLANVTMGDSVETIGADAFDYCRDIKNVYISDLAAWCTITFENEEANPFYDAEENSCLYLDNQIIKELVIPDSITSIDAYTFPNCDGLTGIVLHDGVEKIEDMAFYNCKNLRYVVISENMLYIKTDAFYNCTQMQYVFYKGDAALWEELLIYSGNDALLTSEVIYNPTEKNYHFVTNQTQTLPSVTTYCLAEAPMLSSSDMMLLGWYDNAALLGTPISFPYCGESGTLYAAWTDRTGESFETALVLEESKSYIVPKRNDYEPIYYMFTAKHTGVYRIRVKCDTARAYADLYDGDQDYLNHGSGNEFILSEEIVAGETYYISIELGNLSAECTLMVELDGEVEAPVTVTKVSADGTSFEVTGENIPVGSTVILGLYNNGRFVGMQDAYYDGNTITFTTEQTYTDAYIMVWNTYEDLKPVTIAENVK